MGFLDIEHISYNQDINMLNYHSHSFYELYYLIDGERDYYIGSELYKISSGTLVAIPPYVPHKTEGSVFSRYLVSFDRTLLTEAQADILDNIVDKKIIVLNSNTTGSVINILNDMNKEFNNKLDFHKELIISDIVRMLCLFLRYGKTIEKSKLIALDANKSEIINKIMLYINNNLESKLTLDLLSEKFYISKSHLSRKFAHANKQSISQYIVISRINKARELIKNSDKSMQEIAESVGFNSSNYMNYIFVKYMNISPVKYRQMSD